VLAALDKHDLCRTSFFQVKLAGGWVKRLFVGQFGRTKLLSIILVFFTTDQLKLHFCLLRNKQIVGNEHSQANFD
jgi:hypothetical protein